MGIRPHRKPSRPPPREVTTEANAHILYFPELPDELIYIPRGVIVMVELHISAQRSGSQA